MLPNITKRGSDGNETTWGKGPKLNGENEFG